MDSDDDQFARGGKDAGEALELEGDYDSEEELEDEEEDDHSPQ